MRFGQEGNLGKLFWKNMKYLSSIANSNILCSENEHILQWRKNVPFGHTSNDKYIFKPNMKELSHCIFPCNVLCHYLVLILPVSDTINKHRITASSSRQVEPQNP